MSAVGPLRLAAAVLLILSDPALALAQSTRALRPAAASAAASAAWTMTAVRRGEGDRVRRFAVVLLLVDEKDERVVAHLSLVFSDCALCAALGGADARNAA